MYFKFYQTTTAGENKITTGEQSSFSPSLPAKFAVSRVKNRYLVKAKIHILQKFRCFVEFSLPQILNS